MSQKIKSIQKGDYPHAVRYSIGQRYSKITEEWKAVRLGEGEGIVYRMMVYRVYDEKENMVAELETCGGLVIRYGQDG